MSNHACTDPSGGDMVAPPSVQILGYNRDVRCCKVLMKSFISECENHSETHLHSTSYALTNSWLTLLRPAASTARATLFELSRQSSMYTLPEDAKCASD